MKYKKKPVVIEAEEWTGFIGNPNPHPAVKQKFVDLNGVPTMLNVIETLEGDHIVLIGDFIIKGVKGEFYPCKPDIFEMTYEPVDKKLEGE
jgi:hypothetical protein